MKRSTLAASILAAALCPLLGNAAEHTLITDVTIISPENLDHQEVGSVLIEDDKIAAVLRGAMLKAPPDTKVVSGKGQFLIPGLIDSHVHLAMIPGTDPGQPGIPADLIAAYFKQLPRSYLYFGYTTVIDLAVYDRERLGAFRNAPLHPDQYDCGEPLPVLNGYPTADIPPQFRYRVFPNFVYDPKQSIPLPAGMNAADHTPQAAVAHDKAVGAICVKTFYERGFGRDNKLPVPSAELYAGIRKAASDAHLVLMTHANAFEAQQFAVDGGTDVLAHGMWNWGTLNKEAGLPEPIHKLLDRIVDQQVGYQPTFQVLQGLRAYFDPDYLKNPAIPKVIPAALLAWFNSPPGQWYKKEISSDDAPDAAVRGNLDQGPIRRGQLVAHYLAGKNTKFLFGTDTPSSPTYGNLPGLNGYLEMQRWQQAGLSLRQIFVAATASNAKQFKLDQQFGTLQPGKIANLVLLNKSPLQSIDAYDSIASVWVHGVQVQREALVAP